jgi:hypothetical protein
MSDRIHELEERIMECWSILDHIDTTLQIVDRTDGDIDAVSNALIGIKQLYQTKFEMLFETFEDIGVKKLRDIYKLNNTYRVSNTKTSSSAGGSTTNVIFG